jgi:hypothetical protein
MKAVVVMRFEVESGQQLKNFLDAFGAKLPIAGVTDVAIHEAYYLRKPEPEKSEKVREV